MKQKSLTILRLSIYNLQRKIFRTICLGIVVGMLSFTLFGGSILTTSLNNGMKSMKQRFGADLMVVPKGYEAQTEGILLKGEPKYFYFDKSVSEEISKVEGVTQVTSQFFLTSLSAACCTTSVQLIGFNPETDFVIQPWITKTYHSTIGDGQLIVGSDIVLENDHTLKFYGTSYPIAAQLEKTSTGLDSSVFMNMNTMDQLFSGAKKVGMYFLKEQEPGKSISTVLVKLDESYDAELVAKTIRSSVPNVEVVVPQNMISNIAKNLNSLIIYIRAFSIVLYSLAIVVLCIIFSVTMNERKKEFAIFRILGATRRKLIGLLLVESFMISLSGGIIGTSIASITIFPFSTYIGDKLQLPYIQPQLSVIMGILGLSLCLTIVIGPVTSIYSAIKISKAETYLTMREGE